MLSARLRSKARRSKAGRPSTSRGVGAIISPSLMGDQFSNTTYNSCHAQSVPLLLQAGQLRPQSCPPHRRQHLGPVRQEGRGSGEDDTPSGRLYVSPQRTDESRIHFEELGQAMYPRPYPRPFLCAKDWAGKDVFLCEGRRWYLSHNEEPYRYLCVPEKRLEWCWPIPPNASAVPCKSPDTGEDGWCWRNEVSYRNDS
jgi:hypothetical protein